MLRMQTGVIKSLLLLCIWCNAVAVCAQIKLGSNTVGTTRSAILDLNSANQGLLLPRITDTSATTGVSKYSPPDGMFIFFSTDKSLRIRKNSSWIRVIDSTNALQADWNQANTSSLDYIKNKPTIPNGTVTSIGLTSSDFTISGSPVTTSGTITANLNTQAGLTAGTYTSVTVNSKGIVTAGIAKSQSITTSRTFGTSFQLSATRDAQVVYSVTITSTAAVLAGQSGTIFLEYSPTGTTWTTIGQVTNNIGLGVIVTLAETMQLSGFIPAGYFVRLRTNQNTGTPTFAFILGQEMLY